MNSYGPVLPLHWKHRSVIRDLIQSRTQRNALAVLFTISLVLGLLLILDYPLYPFYSSQVDLEYHQPSVDPPPTVHEISDEASLVQFSDTENGIFYHPFTPPPRAYAIADHTIRPVKSHEQLSSACMEHWVGDGLWDGPCAAENVKDAVIDLVYVWVNGSDPLHQQARAQYITSTGFHPKNARFREHDELRYSLRASVEATRSWSDSVWHLITADVPHPHDPERRLGLVPQWLDLNTSVHLNGSSQPSIYLHHDSQLFRLINSTDERLSVEEAVAWRENVLPTFNSHAIESQMPNLDPGIVSENIVSLNDDQFLTLPMSPSSFHSTLYGPVFRLESHLQVEGDATGKADGGGEWRSLGWSAHLLNERFGSRSRPYVAHNARSFSLPVMHEMSLAYGKQFSATTLSRFRGSHKAANEIEVNTVFLTTHWVIERKREALLWSWIVAKWGGRYDGLLNEEALMEMWRDAGGDDGSTEIPLSDARRVTLDDIDVQLGKAHLQSPRVPNRNLASHTDYSFVSQDGYPSHFTGLKLSSSLYREQCFGSAEIRAWDLFVDVLITKIGCGDAIIAALRQRQDPSGGLSIFLPPGSTDVNPSDPIVLPLQLPLEEPPLPSHPRAFAIRLIHRYSYVVGETPSRFFGLTSYRQAENILQDTTEHAEIALLCINDDLTEVSSDRQLARTDVLLRGWLENRWPNKLDREIRYSEHEDEDDDAQTTITL